MKKKINANRVWGWAVLGCLKFLIQTIFCWTAVGKSNQNTKKSHNMNTLPSTYFCNYQIPRFRFTTTSTLRNVSSQTLSFYRRSLRVCANSKEVDTQALEEPTTEELEEEQPKESTKFSAAPLDKDLKKVGFLFCLSLIIPEFRFCVCFPEFQTFFVFFKLVRVVVRKRHWVSFDHGWILAWSNSGRTERTWLNSTQIWARFIPRDSISNPSTMAGFNLKVRLISCDYWVLNTSWK